MNNILQNVEGLFNKEKLYICFKFTLIRLVFGLKSARERFSYDISSFFPF